LNFNEVDKAITDAKMIRSFTSGNTTRVAPAQKPVVRDMVKTVNAWKKLARKNKGFATMGAFDSLKKELNDVRLGYQHGTPQRLAADRIYNSVRESINDLSKTKNFTLNGKQYNYKDVMKAYDEATDQISELERTLSLGDNSTIDTALRKLNSVMRDTSHTNYGARANLVQALVDNGADNLLQHLAGESLRPGLKPGLASQVGVLGTMGAVFGAGVTPHLLATLAIYSPKLMGNAAYVSGKIGASVARPAMAWEKFIQKRGLSSRGIALGAQQVGRVSSTLQERAAELGYNIHPSVLDRVAKDLSSDNREEYERGVRTIGANPRILKMIEGDEGDAELYTGNGQ
jgi:hypothetical protein